MQRGAGAGKDLRGALEGAMWVVWISLRCKHSPKCGVKYPPKCVVKVRCFCNEEEGAWLSEGRKKGRERKGRGRGRE